MRRLQRGTTLIELTIAIVVISTAAATLVGLLAFISRTGADTMAQAQSASLANAYLTRILAEPFSDVSDHVQSASAPEDLDGNTISGLQDYRVSVAVGSAPPIFPSGDALLVTVSVSDPFGNIVRLSGVKTDH